jgi:flagella basal body P-ring formation protein FlgA
MLSLGWSVDGAIHNYLKDHYPWEEITVADVVPDAPLPSQEPSEIRVLKGPLGRSLFLLVFDNGKTIKARATVAAFDRVIKTKVPVARGQALDEDNIYSVLVNVNRTPKGVLKDIEALRGTIATRSLNADRVLSASDVKNVPDIKRGQPVSIVCEKNRLRITTTGKVREDGYIGKAVKVESDLSGKTFRGVLTARSIVKVRF